MSDIIMKIVQEKFDRKLKEELDKTVEEATEKAMEKATEKAVKEKLTERISLIQKKCARNKSLSRIADDLETDTEEIRSLYEVISKNPEKTAEEIYQIVTGKVQK